MLDNEVVSHSVPHRKCFGAVSTLERVNFMLLPSVYAKTLGVGALLRAHFADLRPLTFGHQVLKVAQFVPPQRFGIIELQTAVLATVRLQPPLFLAHVHMTNQDFLCLEVVLAASMTFEHICFVEVSEAVSHQM